VFTHTDRDGSEVRVMSTGERTGWNLVLRTVALARDARWSPSTLAQGLTVAADRCERQSLAAERRGDHVLATLTQEASEVLDHAVGQVAEHLARA
jgi:hypothetical protein